MDYSITLNLDPCDHTVNLSETIDRPATKTIAMTLFALAFVNFAVFFCVAAVIGGSADAGKIQNGRYYVANHGQYTEVSQGVWTYSSIHVRSIWFTHPIGLLSASLLVLTQSQKSKQKDSARS